MGKGTDPNSLWSVNYVSKGQTPELFFAAVQQSGLALAFVIKQTPAICIAAENQTKWALAYTKG